ncbi:MAG TPA: ATP-binding protein [Candidatus Tectomicrobia bacterium]|nr:ATP-binding protein [Candidatus Tectomicrobia bacterium]
MIGTRPAWWMGIGQQLWPARYALAALLLVVGLVTGLGVLGAWLEARNVRQVSEDLALALTEAMETSGRNALLANLRLEEAIAQRLLDHARLLDRLLQHVPLSNQLLAELAARNGLDRIEVLDAQGNVLASSAIRLPAPMQEHLARHGMEMRGLPPMLRHWYEPLLRGQAQQALQGFGEQRFWLGRQYAVAIRRQESAGIIAISADAGEIIRFRQEVGLQRLLNDLASNPMVAYVSLQNPELTIVAHTDAARVGATAEDAFLRQALSAPRPSLRTLAGEDGLPLLEVVRPFPLGDTALGLLRVGLKTEHLTVLWRRSLLILSTSGLGLLAVGGVGMHLVFRAQARHHARVRALERALSRQERLAALGHLSAGVAHEVRNPLNAIGMGIQRLQGEFSPVEGEEEFRHLCMVIRGEVARLNGIVQEFLELARAPAPQREPVAVATLVHEVATLMEAEAKEHAVRLTLQVPEGLPSLFVDPQQLKQALLNLLLNAIQATPPGGFVQLTAAADAEALRLAIIDSGRGIAPELMDRIFDPYFTTKPDGTGLGLPIALRIIQAHGGTLDVSSALGGGTTMEVRLPIATPGREAMQPPATR